MTDAKGNRVIVHRFCSDGPTLDKRLYDRSIISDPNDGFLRGIAVVNGLVFVGVTVQRGPGADLRYARIIALRRDTLELCGEFVIPGQYGRQVFSVLDASEHHS